MFYVKIIWGVKYKTSAGIWTSARFPGKVLLFKLTQFIYKQQSADLVYFLN
jgi:hypothetical protein